MGFKNHIQYALKMKSANKIENVQEFLEAYEFLNWLLVQLKTTYIFRLRLKLKPINEEDYSILQNFAFKNNEYGKLNIYDISYWRYVSPLSLFDILKLRIRIFIF